MNFRQFTSWIAVLNGNKHKKDLHHGLGDVHKAHAQTVTYIQQNKMREKKNLLHTC